MGFTNPATTVDVNPDSTIAVVTTSVPFPNRDAFFWPGIAGEGFPPTFSGAAVYSNAYGNPCYLVSPGGPSTGTVTSPRLPRTSYSGKEHLTFMCTAWIPSATSNVSIQLGSTSGPGAVMQLTSDGAVVLSSYDASGTLHNAGTFVSAFEQGQPLEIQIDLNADGSISFSLDGRILATTTHKDWPPAGLPTIAAAAAWQFLGAPNAAFYAAGINVDWV